MEGITQKLETKMKKHYISPLITFEYIEDEDLMIAMSHTQIASHIIDPTDTSTDTPAIIGDEEAPIVIGGDDTGDF